MKSNIKQVICWYNAMTGDVEWTVRYKSRRYRMYEKDKLPKSVSKWLQQDNIDNIELMQIGDTGTSAWHVERWEVK